MVVLFWALPRLFYALYSLSFRVDRVCLFVKKRFSPLTTIKVSPASLQVVCGSGLQLHALRLASDTLLVAREESKKPQFSGLAKIRWWIWVHA